MQALKFIVASTLVLVAAPLAADDDAGKESKPTEIEKALAKFDRTGETKKCVNPGRIRNMRVVDDNHIIFELPGRTYYLNNLPRRCRSLGFHESIMYKVRGGSLCERELFQVLDGSSIPGAHCSFGKFEKLVKKKPSEKEGAE
jgi:hypothetical protein